MLRIAFGNAPTPGSTAPSEARIASWSLRDVRRARRSARAPSRRSAGCPSRSRGSRSAGRCAHSTPFVEGTPVSESSSDVAARSARANDLKLASIMWCAFVPASRRTCTVSRALFATARKNSSASSVSQPPIVASGIEPSNAQYGRPRHVDRARRQRLVHRHGRVAVARDAAAVAERLVERLAEHDADVLGGVVRAGLEVAGRLDVEVEARVAREQVEHVVEEPDAGRGRALAGAVQREPQADAGLAWWSARSRRRAVVS